ncbi:MAG: hypothetical protein ACLFQK_03305 [Fibrobacterota bacterium]
MKHIKTLAALLAALMLIVYSGCLFDSDGDSNPDDDNGTVMCNTVNSIDIVDSIDISGFANPAATDGVPQAAVTVFEGGKAYTALQRQNTSSDWWTADSVGLVIVIDVTDDLIEDTIRLSGRNPQDMVVSGSYLYVGTGGYTAGDGAIEKIDPASGNVTELADVADLDANLGAVGSVVAGPSGTLYAGIYNASTYNTEVWAIDISNGSGVKLDSITNAAAGVYDSEKNRVFVADRGGYGENLTTIDVFDASDNSYITTVNTASLPPNSMDICESWLIVTCSDYVSGDLNVIDLTDLSVSDTDISISQDSKVKAVDGTVFIFERTDADNLTVLNSTLDGIASQTALGAGVNASDIDKIDSETAYLTLYGAGDIKLVSLQ